MHAINANENVMRFFERTLSRDESKAFIDKMQTMQREKGYCYYATELLNSGRLIGMIGLGYKDFEADFTPCVDIGWRLDEPFWGKGYAPEGAARCLQYAFEALALPEVLCIAPSANLPSVRVMEKIHLHKIKHFNHPQLKDCPPLQDCVLYGITAAEYTRL
jgi:RimJ/RimL family protein N-acetyltransferase